MFIKVEAIDCFLMARKLKKLVLKLIYYKLR